MAPQPPQRSERPGAAVALLDYATGDAPRWPPKPPNARSVPAQPWRSSITRQATPRDSPRLVERRGYAPRTPPAYVQSAPAQPRRSSITRQATPRDSPRLVERRGLRPPRTPPAYVQSAPAQPLRSSTSRVGGGRAHDVRCVVEHHPPAVGLALEDVRGDDRGDRHATPHLGEDVLGAGDPGEAARDGELDVADGEADLARVVEDGLPRGPDVVPAGEQGPARVHALDVLAVRPHFLHLGEIEGLERAIEARVGLLDVESGARHAV